MNNGGGGVAELTEALNTYQGAAAEERSFLENAAEIDEVKTELTALGVTEVDATVSNDVLSEAIDNAVDTAAADVQGSLDAHDGDAGFKNYDFEEASNAVRQEIITEFRAELEKGVDDTRKTLVDATASSQVGRANTLVSAESAYEDAAVALAGASKALDAEIAKFLSLNDTATIADTKFDSSNRDQLEADVTDYVVGADVLKVVNNRVVLTETAQAAEYEGTAALLEAANAEYQAQVNLLSAQSQLDSAITNVLRGEKPDAIFGTATEINLAADAGDGETFTIEIADGASVTFDAAAAAADAETKAELASELVALLVAEGVTASAADGTITIEGVEDGDITLTGDGFDTGGSNDAVTADDASFDITPYYNAYDGDLDNAYLDLSKGEFNADVNLEAGAVIADLTTDYFEAQGALQTFNKAVEDFRAIESVQTDAGEAAQQVEDAVAAIEEFDVELNLDNVGTEANDLFVYAEEAMTVSNFGLQGDDQLYLGEGFTAVRPEGDVATDREGDSAVLEVFFQQVGNNAVIYVENEAFAGNAENANDLTQITLTGVDAESLVYENGVISIA